MHRALSKIVSDAFAATNINNIQAHMMHSAVCVSRHDHKGEQND